MSAQVKKAGRIGTKIVASFLFLVLIMFNVEVGLYDGETSKGGILGLTMSVFVPELLANSTCVDERAGCQGTIRTFSCASDICGNSAANECYICISSDPGEN